MIPAKPALLLLDDIVNYIHIVRFQINFDWIRNLFI